jgi:hypothetical protein
MPVPHGIGEQFLDDKRQLVTVRRVYSGGIGKVFHQGPYLVESAQL